MRIAVFGNTYHEAIRPHIALIVDYFKQMDVVLLFDKVLFDYVCSGVPMEAERVEMIAGDDFEADLALSVGGDGTFLTTASRVGRKQIPVLGINIGRLGFLADVANDEVSKALDAFIHGDYMIEERTLLSVETSDGTLLDHPYALNEVAILKQNGSSMIGVNTSVNGEALHTYQADGLLVSTPTGSTAYSLSVGGPIVVPQARNLLLSPVSSHSLNVRPLIIPDTWHIDLEVSSRSGSYLLAVDGRSKVLGQEVKLHISKADYTVRLVKPKGYSFFDALKSKLMWGVDKRN